MKPKNKIKLQKHQVQSGIIVKIAKKFEPITSKTDKVAKKVIDAAFKVHNTLGPGLLESVYETCLAHELNLRNIPFERQKPIPISYEGMHLESDLRVDLIVDKLVLVELKAVEKMIPLFEAQLLTYLKLTNIRLGLLINFNVPLIKDGIKRIAL
jgi:GxxExxY protein